MYDRLQSHIARLADLTDEEFAFLKTLFIPKKLRRKHDLLQEGDVCKYIAFVDKGLLRTYTVDSKGTEHIIQFALEGWWTSDLYSYLTSEPSGYTIEALEDSELLLLELKNMERMVEVVPKMERYLRILLQNNYIATHRRIVLSLSQSAEEKYTEFLQRYPEIVQRVPQHMIASYLGITPAFLSRIRARKHTTD
ncbi:cyclic nucleotide-binding domain-containing protein [Spirosoma sp. HMF3257]|uniref:Crp/Fnr family transcriptional regulator n=1 Tax=Spirosoma telluris TaxID=2183553 RepID=A0A327NIM6_9BACT|nr:cyclic nucleotide-binding domain-containing protein [Spirosoma telluris]RAI75180.1 Crp/Fnr family transcriptional regulator [Spirosoma telluris]